MALLAMFPVISNSDSEAHVTILEARPIEVCYEDAMYNKYAFNIIDLKQRVAIVETGYAKNPYILKNKFGYMGIFQFHRRTLKSLIKRGLLKASNRDIKNYLYDHDLQNRSMDALLVHNARLAVKYNSSVYIGKTIGGITITMEKILAGSHFLGFFGMKDFLESNNYTVELKRKMNSKKDGNGIGIVEYLKRYEKYGSKN